jgi:uncharacterized protein (DUF2236 family)
MKPNQLDAAYGERVAQIPFDPVAGYFGPDSISWRLYREPIVILGGPRALLLQIAHPAVAVGVERYSNFRADALGRGLRTFLAMASIYFGDAAQARATAGRLYRIHSHIRGAYATPGQPGEHAFVATDPDLLSWVLATLTDTTLLVFENIALPGLPPDWRERFYAESRIAARLLGIPDEFYPADLASFRTYFDSMLHSDLLGSSPVCRELADAIVYHRFSPAPLSKLLAAGWLPDPLSARLGVTTRQPQSRLRRLLRGVQAGYRLLPRGLRYSPAYYQAQARLARSRGARPPLLGRWYDWLARRLPFPLGLPEAH